MVKVVGMSNVEFGDFVKLADAVLLMMQLVKLWVAADKTVSINE